MNTLRNDLKRDYSQIPNELIIDRNISHGALRVLLYLFTKPDNWNVYNKDICKQLSISENTLTKYWKELLSSKWLRRERKKDDSGKFISGNYFYEIGNFTVSPKVVETEETIEHSNNNSIQKKETGIDDFNKIWNFYGKVGSKAKALSKYSSKSFNYSDEKIMIAIKRYFAAKEDWRDKKHLTTFLGELSDWIEDYEEKPTYTTQISPTNTNWKNYV